MQYCRSAAALAVLGCGSNVSLGTDPKDLRLTDEMLWVASPGDAPSPSEGRGVALAADGVFGVMVGYVTVLDALQRPERDAYVTAFDAAGTFLWSRTFDLADRADEAVSALVTAEHESVVGGSTTDADGVRRGWIRKFSRHGDLLWEELEPSGGNEIVNDLALGSAGEIIAVGYVNSFQTGKDVWIWTYDLLTGKAGWGDFYDGASHGDDEAVNVAAWNSGNTWAAGYQQTTPGAGKELMSIEWTASGTRTGVRPLTPQASISGVSGLALNETNGDYLVCGTRALFDRRSAAVIYRRDNSGAEVWERTYEGENAESNVAGGCTFSAGDTLVVGTEAAQETARQLFIARYDSLGQRLWLRRPAGLTSGNAVSVGPDGSAYVAGSDTAGRATLTRFRP